jgi:hypothetical protein
LFVVEQPRVVGYNVQSAVETKHHLIVAHEVTNHGYDRDALAMMATIADFRRDNGPAIRKVCRQFVALCRDIDLLDGRHALQDENDEARRD